MASRGVNKVILVGNLGRDPETRYAQNGNAVTSFSVATSETWRDRTTGENQERTEWHNVVCFSRLAEIAGEYLRKGSKVYIEGSRRTSSWEQDGQKRYKTDIQAREMQMLDSRGGAGGMGGQGGGMGAAAAGGGMGAAAGGAMGAPSGFDGPQQMPVDNGPTLTDDTNFEDDIPF